MSPELINVIFQVSRWLFAFLGMFAALSALGWLHAEKKARRERLRSVPAAGTVGELMVISGSDELPVQTWFPVTREGVLGSVRSCDLVVPCPGVKAHHLDYAWKDGCGLIVRPRSGCEAWINGIRLDCRSDVLSYPLTHGACLQVGQAVLRLQVFKALNPVYEAPAEAPEPRDSFQPEEIVAFPGADPAAYFTPEAPSSPYPASGTASPYPAETYPSPYSVPGAPPVPASGMNPSAPVSVPYGAVPDVRETPRTQPAPPRRRSDSWKEDWSE